MARIRRLVLAAVVASLLPLVLVAGPAAAQEAPGAGAEIAATPGDDGGLTSTRRIGCRGPGNYLKFYNNTGTLCFADAGSLNVFIEGVYTMWSGDNAGYIKYGRGLDVRTFYFQKYRNYQFNPAVRVWNITIY